MLSNLNEQVNSLNVKLDEFEPQLDDQAQSFINACDELHYNIIFIGNSITRHSLSEYWWSDTRGMASSSLEKDYVHLVENGIADKVNEIKSSATSVNGYAFNYSIWETQLHDRAETYPMMDKFLIKKNNIDCIVLQLGENVSDADDDNSTYESDYAALVEHIKSECPEATIITVGDFWKDDTKDKVKKSVAESENVEYVDLSAIQDEPNYQAGMRTMVEGDDGQEHQIEHSGVAKHPGDKGMKWIGNEIIKMISN